MDLDKFLWVGFVKRVLKRGRSDVWVRPSTVEGLEIWCVRSWCVGEDVELDLLLEGRDLV
jgi:hypothetical protein